MTSLTGYKDNATTETPILFRFFKAEAHNAVQTELSNILGSMWFDRELEAGLAATALFATAMDLVLRLQQYREYPCRLSTLCSRWNPVTYLTAIIDFLYERDGKLDIGYSLQLKRIAWSKGSEMLAIAFLASSSVQEARDALYSRNGFLIGCGAVARAG